MYSLESVVTMRVNCGTSMLEAINKAHDLLQSKNDKIYLHFNNQIHIITKTNLVTYTKGGQK